MTLSFKFKAWERGSALLAYLILAAGAAIMVLPLWWTLITAVKVPQETMTYPTVWIPSKITLAHLERVWNASFPIYYRNSIIVAVGVVVAQLLSSALGGFIFAKYDFPLKNALFILLLSTMMIPFAVVLIPTYLLVAQFMGLKDNLLGLIIPSLTSAFGIFLMRQFMHGIPDEMLDAARMDGASETHIFLRIVLPLSTPALSALAIFCFIGIWNDFLWPLLIADSDAARTLPIGVAFYVFQRWQQYNLVIAASVFLLVPMLLFYALFQRAFVQGIVFTGMKY